MTTMRIRSYSKSELAMLYFPDAKSAHVATNRLNGWINRCSDLTEALALTHYNKNARFFTPNQVGLIIKYIGEP